MLERQAYAELTDPRRTRALIELTCPLDREPQQSVIGEAVNPFSLLGIRGELRPTFDLDRVAIGKRRHVYPRCGYDVIDIRRRI